MNNIKETLKQLVCQKQVFQTPDGLLFESENDAIEFLHQKIVTNAPPSKITQFLQGVKMEVQTRRNDPP